MSERKRVVTGRLTTLVESNREAEDDWPNTTVEERIDAVDFLTRLCLEWQQGGDGDVPRLQRSVARLRPLRG